MVRMRMVTLCCYANAVPDRFVPGQKMCPDCYLGRPEIVARPVSLIKKVRESRKVN